MDSGFPTCITLLISEPVSDLHMYRGHQKTGVGQIMVCSLHPINSFWARVVPVKIGSTQLISNFHPKGHEFVGTVESVGHKITKFKPGDKVVSVFATIW